MLCEFQIKHNYHDITANIKDAIGSHYSNDNILLLDLFPSYGHIGWIFIQEVCFCPHGNIRDVILPHQLGDVKVICLSVLLTQQGEKLTAVGVAPLGGGRENNKV